MILARYEASPMRVRQTASGTVEPLARDLAIARGILRMGGHLAELNQAEQGHFRNEARVLAAMRDSLAETMAVHLRRSLAYKMYGCGFDRLHLHEREEIAEIAAAAWLTTVDVLAGKAAGVPQWERECLTFSGPYDPALLGAGEKETVQ